MRADSAVEPTKSENITVTWRRSAVSCGALAAMLGGRLRRRRLAALQFGYRAQASDADDRASNANVLSRS